MWSNGRLCCAQVHHHVCKHTRGALLAWLCPGSPHVCGGIPAVYGLTSVFSPLFPGGHAHQAGTHLRRLQKGRSQTSFIVFAMIVNSDVGIMWRIILPFLLIAQSALHDILTSTGQLVNPHHKNWYDDGFGAGFEL